MKKTTATKNNKRNQEHTTRATKKKNQIRHFLRKHCRFTEGESTKVLAALTRKYGANVVFDVLKWRRNNNPKGCGLDIQRFLEHFNEAKEEFEKASEIRPIVLQAIHDLENE